MYVYESQLVKNTLLPKPQRVPQRRLVASAKPMCTYDKVLNQRVDWVVWASIQIYGARDAIDDTCKTSSGVGEGRMRWKGQGKGQSLIHACMKL